MAIKLTAHYRRKPDIHLMKLRPGAKHLLTASEHRLQCAMQDFPLSPSEARLYRP